MKYAKSCLEMSEQCESMGDDYSITREELSLAKILNFRLLFNDTSIKLSPYRQFSCLLSLIPISSSVFIPVSFHSF